MTNQPYSEQYRLAGLDWVEKDAAARLLEEGKTAFLSQRKMQTGLSADSAAEREVKASAEWSDYIKKMTAARTAANRAKIKMEFVKMRAWEATNTEANKRAEMKL
jgi:hypothetical protein